MSFRKFKSDSYCVGGGHKSGTKNIVGEITYNKKSGKEIKLLVGKCVICDKRKSMIVSDNVIQAEGLGDFFKSLGKKRIKCIKKDGKKRIKQPRTSLRLNSNNSNSSSFSKFQTGFINITRVDNVLQHRQRLVLGQICLIYII